MEPTVREMQPDETSLVIDYFHKSTPEHLSTMGVDPTRLPTPEAWTERFRNDFILPPEKRYGYYVIWLLDNRPIGFSSCDRITIGESAKFHLHVTDPEHRQQGIGTECVRQSIEIYFDKFSLKKLYCEPNAFNVAPNRTLRNIGFRYLKTHMTVPGPINYHQAVTRWVMER